MLAHESSYDSRKYYLDKGESECNHGHAEIKHVHGNSVGHDKGDTALTSNPFPISA